MTVKYTTTIATTIWRSGENKWTTKPNCLYIHRKRGEYVCFRINFVRVVIEKWIAHFHHILHICALHMLLLGVLLSSFDCFRCAAVFIVLKIQCQTLIALIHLFRFHLRWNGVRVRTCLRIDALVVFGIVLVAGSFVGVFTLYCPYKVILSIMLCYGSWTTPYIQPATANSVSAQTATNNSETKPVFGLGRRSWAEQRNKKTYTDTCARAYTYSRYNTYVTTHSENQKEELK